VTCNLYPGPHHHQSWPVVPTGNPNHNAKLQWNWLNTLALILLKTTDRMDQWQTNRPNCITSALRELNKKTRQPLTLRSVVEMWRRQQLCSVAEMHWHQSELLLLTLSLLAVVVVVCRRCRRALSATTTIIHSHWSCLTNCDASTLLVNHNCVSRTALWLLHMVLYKFLCGIVL